MTDQTTDVLLECALFAPGPIRSTRKALGLSTDASYRFERGVDPEGMVRALLRTAQVVVATAGGEVTGPIVDCCPTPFERTTTAVRPERVERLLGVPFRADEIRNLLVPLGFAVDGDDGELQVAVPGFRSYDVTREVDLIEEVARTHGYDRFPETSRPYRASSVRDHPLFELEARLREELAAWGLLEAQTPAFAPEGEGEVELANPISAEEGVLRGALLPGLVRRLEHNLARGNRDVRLFEIGTAFHRGRDRRDAPAEETRLAAVLHGRRRPPHWSEEDVAWDEWDLRGLLDRVAALLAGEGWTVRVGRKDRPEGPDPFDPGTRFEVVDREGARVGAGGRVLAGTADLPRWAGDVWAFEVALPATPKVAPDIAYRPLPTHPGVERDLALLVADGTEVAEVVALIERRAGEHLEDVEVFDVYRDPRMSEAVRSVAVRLRFRAAGRTLTDREVDDAVASVAGALKEEFDVGIRGREG